MWRDGEVLRVSILGLEDDPECRTSAIMGHIGVVENPRVREWCELLD